MNLLINFLAILSILSCQQGQNKTLEKDDYSVNYPVHLELDVSGQDGTSFILKTQKEGDNDFFIENINLVITDAKKTSFNDLVNKAKTDIGSVADIVEGKSLDINGKNCFKMTFKLTQNNIDFTVVQHYFLENQKAYLLTFTSETSKFKKYFDEINKVFSSFKIK